MLSMLRRVGTGTLAAIASFLMLPGPAQAAAVCTFSDGVLTLSLQVGTGTLRIVREGIHIAVTDGGAPVDCGAPGPTVFTVDAIHVVEGPVVIDSTVEIDLSGGPFAPGATPDGSPEPEIGFDLDLGDRPADRVTIIGSDLADHITLSSEGINLNADELVPDVDLVLTGVGRVRMEMGEGDDVVDAGGASPTAFPVRLRIEGGPGADTLTGGAAGDVLLGQADDDVLVGGPGDDDLDGGAGADVLSGGEGNDLLRGGPGADQETGGSGNDVFDQGDVADGGDDLDGGPGDDTVAYDLRAADVTVTLDDAADDGEAGEGDNARSSIERVLGGGGDDTLTGNGGANVLVGGRGSDTLDGGPGDDVLNGGPGDDVLNGGPGTDLASYFDADAGVTVSLADGTATGDGEDTLVAIENVTGTAYADVLEGEGGPNVLIGRRGRDLLLGRGGDDTLDGGRGRDTLDGGRGRDALYGRRGDDTLDGGRGRDLLVGGRGADRLDGGPGFDRCRPGRGRDRIRRCEA